MKKIAIDIDFILRDWVSMLINEYRKQIDNEWDEKVDLENLYESFKFPQYTYIEEEIEGSEIDNEDKINESIMVIDDSKESIVNKEYFDKFISDNIPEIFGHAKETERGSIQYLNTLEKTNKELEITLFSKVGGKARGSTLFFLSKYGCEVSNIKFIKSYEELNNYDIVVSSKNINTHNHCILYSTEYNEDLKVKVRIDFLKDLEYNL